jgi:AraC-like DNA-binding protein
MVDNLDYIFRLMATSQVLSWIVYILYFHRTRVGYLASTLFIGIAFYLVTPVTSEWGWDTFAALARFAGNLIPAVVWLLAWNLFSDDSRIPTFFFVVAPFYLLLVQVPADLQSALIPGEPYQQLTFFFLPQVIKLGLVLHVIYLALSRRREDLVEGRLRMRVPFACLFAVIISAVIVTEIGFSDDVPGSVETLGSAVYFVLTVLGTALSMRLRPELAALVELISPVEPALAEETENPIIAGIRQLMEADRFYANYDVTLDVMALQLKLPAYRLRPIINQQMGFKNFNQFLNSFRIAEASERLLSEQELPILTIALDTGFKSLSAFNKAFKDTHSMTPSEFRRQTTG